MLNHQQKTINYKQKNGQAAMTAVIFLIFIMLSMLGAVTFTSLSVAKGAERSFRSRTSFFASEAGIDDAVYRFKRGKNVSGSFTLLLNGAVSTTTINTPLPSQKEIISSSNFNESFRALKSILSTGFGTSFVYGVQVGAGGLEMENTSKIIGSVYSNGHILGGNSPSITGDAFAAGTSRIDGMTVNGSARAGLIINSTVGVNATSSTDVQSVTIGKNAYANNIINSTIGQNAYFWTSISGSSVGGSQFPSTPIPSVLPAAQMPIPDSQIDTWESDATSGGIISSPCPYQPANGVILGPIQINCDVIIEGTKIVTMNGIIWIKGNFKIKNSAQLKLASSFGTKSGILIVDNPSNRLTSSQISVENSSKIIGSGSPGSYILAISRNNSAEFGGGTKAIDVQNSANAPIYYAPHGSIHIENNANLKEATAYKLEIENSATVTYESGIANANFSSGPSGGWSISEWKEVIQ